MLDFRVLAVIVLTILGFSMYLFVALIKSFLLSRLPLRSTTFTNSFESKPQVMGYSGRFGNILQRSEYCKMQKQTHIPDNTQVF